ncbi:hypothetical protein ABMA28_007441 [Loxostege sticticalis]|uniref:Integrase catalytic domain-containing protein n=1 Tax=Loxostege sticticalis TaxID=481309 RepID=A0ABD0SJS0_LOXSC
MRSAQAASVRSSLSVKARKAAAVAAFQRRRYEQQKQLAQQLAEVEQAELDAELERIDMEAEDVRSHRKNVARLQNVLRGPAREAVASLLVSAEDPEEVMRALERNFARPEMIVFGEVQSLKTLPRIGNELKELGSIANKAISSNPLRSKLEILSDFLTNEHDRFVRFSLTPELSSSLAIPTKSYDHLKRENIHTVSQSKNKTTSKTCCSFCEKNHNINRCEDFLALDVSNRWRWLRENKVCYKCLSRSPHQWRLCKVNACGINGCLFRHHPLLHETDASTSSQAPSVSNNTVLTDQNENESNVTVSNTGVQRASATGYKTLLKIVPVTVSGPKGSFDTYALLDDGSTATLIDSNVASRIGLSGPEESITVNGVGGLQMKTKISYVDFYIKGKTKPIEFINHCQIFDTSSPETTSPEYEKLEALIKEHYKLDSLGISKRETVHSKQDLRALEILESTTKRLPTGRYEVGLPWRDDIQHVPDSYPQALSRFLSLEKRMLREPDFADAYKKFIDNMIDKGYAEECAPITYYNRSFSCDNSAFSNPTSSDTLIKKKSASGCSYPAEGKNNGSIRLYLPHFGVFHPQKRKLRVVHDAAATNQGVSLNSLLLQGPDLLENLLGILFRFREGQVALTADIKEMFPQIRIREEDRDALRFLWREAQFKSTKPIKEYRMTAVVFGASSSPFTALYIKNKNAMSLQNEYPEAVHAIIHDHYMDDCLVSLDDVTKAAQLAADIVTVHAEACFEMRGWVSNNVEALRLVPEELRAMQPAEVQLGTVSTSIKALGVSWDPQSDTLSFRTGLDNTYLQTKDLTKRKALSHLMKVYDPLGLLGPIIVKGRILLQVAWRSNIDWDKPFPPSVVLKWNEWFKELSNVSNIKIPRWYASQNGEPLHRELHVFADASELAYACVAYWRFLYNDGTVKLVLISSKARVAPLKPTSIPRLELQAALIASRLAVTIKEFHKKKPIRTFLWTDSKTVLGWLRSDARSYKPFGAHRIGEITENSCVQDWRWVPTDLNVADDATRMNPLHLSSSHRWFTGPSFLFKSAEYWPLEPIAVEPVQQEIKSSEFVRLLSVCTPKLTTPVTANFGHFSSWLRLVRSTARVFQAVEIFRSFLNSAPGALANRRKASTAFTPLTSELMKAAERHILQKLQLDSFKEELQCLLTSQQISKKSRLYKLSPVLGEDNLLRLHGRIKVVEGIGSELKTPILLDGRHPVVRLLVHHYHRQAGHANNQTVLNEIRQKYWLLHLRDTVRSVASKCLFCRIRKAKPLNPRTGDLPIQRLAHHRRPFTFTGVDYFGPVQTTIGRKREKRYVALFTCMTSRAIHLELVHSLSADSAIMCIRRFIARRGTPDTIYSDNGTAFVGANRLLREFYDSKVQDFSANLGIQWSFIPAAAPFFGGCWERLIRNVKVALGATLKERAPKEEVLITLLLEAESLVNSRPLSHVSVDSDDQESLTPFHFLIGSSSNQRLPTSLDDRDLFGRQDWKKALRLADHFWSRWVKEVLPLLVHSCTRGRDVAYSLLPHLFIREQTTVNNDVNDARAHSEAQSTALIYVLLHSLCSIYLVIYFDCKLNRIISLKLYFFFQNN